jgi:hypothetical protein
VLIGNPTRPYGGTGGLFGEVLPATDYEVVDISREYDWASDFPNKPLSPLLVDAAEPDNASTLTAVADTTDATETGPPAASADTAGPTTHITGGNKFEPSLTGSNGSTTVGGQRHSGSKPIGSVARSSKASRRC